MVITSRTDIRGGHKVASGKGLAARSPRQDELEEFDRLAKARGTVFDTVAWTALFGDQLRRYGIYDAGGRLRGGFFLYQEKRFGLRIMRDPQFTGSCGPFFETLACNPVRALEEQREVLECMADRIERERPAAVSVSLPRGLADALPFYWRSFKVISLYKYVIDLEMTIDQIVAGMERNCRNDIANARKNQVEVVQSEDFSCARDLARATFDRQKKRVDLTKFDQILSSFAKTDNSYLMVARRDDTVIAFFLVVHDRTTAYGILSGYDSCSKQRGAAAAVLFEAIRHAKTIGLRAFDTQGSVIPGIEQFLRGFGGRLTPYLRVNKAWLPLEMILKLRFRQLF